MKEDAVVDIVGSSGFDIVGFGSGVEMVGFGVCFGSGVVAVGFGIGLGSDAGDEGDIV